MQAHSVGVRKTLISVWWRNIARGLTNGQSIKGIRNKMKKISVKEKPEFQFITESQGKDLYKNIRNLKNMDIGDVVIEGFSVRVEAKKDDKS